MNKENILLHEQINRIQEMSGLNSVGGKHLVVVDIQPEYSSYISFLSNFIDFLNENYDNVSRITFLYNGYDTMGMVNENEYQMWWLENGLDESVLDVARFYDKGYAFFRYCMDEGVDVDKIVGLIKLMVREGVNDSRDLDEEFWDKFISEYGHEDVRELLEYSDDCVNIPDLMDELSNYKNIILCGGGINQCLKEVEIALMSLDKNYSVLTKYTY
jgi:hypothetical protein